MAEQELPITIVRTLSDGQQVLVGAYGDLKEARKIIEELSKYWPGDYTILASAFSNMNGSFRITRSPTKDY